MEINWGNENNQSKYSLKCSIYNEMLPVTDRYYRSKNNYFKSRESLFAAVREIGKENVIKYILK